MLVIWPYAWDLQDMIRGKLGIQSEPSPAVSDILPLRSRGSLCSLTYLAFHSEKHSRCHFLASGHLPHCAAITAAMQLPNVFTAPHGTTKQQKLQTLSSYFYTYTCTSKANLDHFKPYTVSYSKSLTEKFKTPNKPALICELEILFPFISVQEIWLQIKWNQFLTLTSNRPLKLQHFLSSINLLIFSINHLVNNIMLSSQTTWLCLQMTNVCPTKSSKP